jgi:hypothetical protein
VKNKINGKELKEENQVQWKLLNEITVDAISWLLRLKAF